MSGYLFPRRQTRRDFLLAAGVVGTSLAVGGQIAVAEDAVAPVKIGNGTFTYTLDSKWGVLPAGMKYGHGCAIVIDGGGRVIVTSRSENPCVAIFDQQGQVLETWSKDFATSIGYEHPGQVSATAHGLYWSKEGDAEFLYWTENAGPNNSGRRVYKTDMHGKVLYTLGNVTEETATSQKVDFKNPTDVAVAPNGDIYVVDGYGSQLVYQYDKNFKHLKTIGGPGADHGKFNTCHGVWVSTLKPTPEVWIADRGNNRIEIYSLELDYLRTISGVRNPCCFYQHDGRIYVPELGARLAIIDGDDKIVATLGDGAGIPGGEIDKHPDKFATPHALVVSAKGDIYLLEWLPHGRVRKFAHTPA